MSGSSDNNVVPMMDMISQVRHVTSGGGASGLMNLSSTALVPPSYLLAATALASARNGSFDSPSSTQSASAIVSTDLDSMAQSQRRKMQRRQANRKSAQLSRARKKAHLEELKEENLKLQHLADILDSQSEFIFSFTPKGIITHIPERIGNMIKSAADDPEEEIHHISQILTPESVGTLMSSLKEIAGSGRDLKTQDVTFVKEVYYHDATGFPVAGFMRCSRLIRRKRAHSKLQADDGSSDSEFSDDKSNHKSKCSKKSNSKCTTTLDGRGHGCSGAEDEEFVCVIRPASTSSPFLNNLHLLSAASMVAHDSVTKQSPSSRKRIGSPSDGSNSSGIPHSSLTTEQSKDSTNSSGSNSAGSNSSEDRSNHSEEITGSSDRDGSEDNDYQSGGSRDDSV